MRWVTLLCVGVAALSGCAAIEDYHYAWVNHRRAALAWHHTSTVHDRVDASAHFTAGWKQGYYDVCTGGSGAPPALPPKKYWSPHYQGMDGQAAIEDWFAGYQDGATTAQSTGVGEWHPIATGPTVPTIPACWPTVEIFPTQPPPTEVIPGEPTPVERLKSVTSDEPQTLTPAESVSQWPVPSKLTRETPPQELETFPPPDTSRRLPTLAQEANVVPPADDVDTPTTTTSVPPTTPTPATTDSSLAPPVYTDE